MPELVSILIPSYNAAHSIETAVRSCLNQSYHYTELLVLDNGSTDNTLEVLESIKDERIRLIKLEKNLGIAPARNILLNEAKGAFIAWLDADDRMLQGRIEAQLNYFYEHPETDILGSWIKTDNEEIPVKQLPLRHEEIAHCLWFKNTIIQPSVMSRNFYKAEGIYYNEAFTNSVEDYELWYRLRHVKKFANIPEYLTVYHLTTGIDLDMKKRFNEFESNLGYLWKSKWRDMPLNLGEKDREVFRFFLYNNRTLTTSELNGISKTLKSLRQHNKDSFFRLIISYHYLRLWQNMNFMYKIINLHLLLNLKYYSRMKELYLISE